ncbi:MAG: 3-hydroxyacyl-CoA dehydrogenase NAD-binding domain-containing protein [Candidatus Delongbacteria bacterium]|nr:3-hydroxyacyl-CoA dehydrogenase NAD-binding domain-containing protein [Candidatus Delongbacteria bacterium]
MKIAVAGTGYVGLVAGVCFAEMGHKVVCVDIDNEKIKRMKKGISPIYEEGLEELMQKNYTAGRIDYTTDYRSAYKDADVCFIFTEWEQVKALLPSDYKKLMRTSLIFDGRNIYSLKDMIKAEVEYYSIGR